MFFSSRIDLRKSNRTRWNWKQTKHQWMNGNINWWRIDHLFELDLSFYTIECFARIKFDAKRIWSVWVGLFFFCSTWGNPFGRSFPRSLFLLPINGGCCCVWSMGILISCTPYTTIKWVFQKSIWWWGSSIPIWLVKEWWLGRNKRRKKGRRERDVGEALWHRKRRPLEILKRVFLFPLHAPSLTHRPIQLGS